jgi:type I restriction enzyme S subunit
MAVEWNQTTVGEVTVRVTKGTTPTALGGHFVENGINFVKVESLAKDGRILTDKLAHIDAATDTLLSRSRLEQEDILFTIAGTIGRTALVPSWLLPANTNQAVAIVRPKREIIDPRFLFYILRDERRVKHAQTRVVQSVQANFSLSELSSLEILLPPLAEQKAIAAVLGALDDKIELNRRMNGTLEAMARALFQSWFVDFDPVRAKLDGREPVGLDSDTAAFFPEHFDHGEHDMLPVGWGLVAIEEVCAINAWTLGKYDDMETLEYVEISEVSRGNITNIANYQRGEEPSRARRRLRHGDTVLSTVRPDRGSYFLSLNPPENRVCSTGFAVLTPSKVPWSYLHVALTLPEVSDHLGQMADGGAYPTVRPEVIGAMQVSLPKNPKVLEAFHRTCAPLFEQAEANRTQSRTLATLRDTLLPKLLSGELQPTQSCPTGETLCQTT